jgi:hypothetical protein
MMRHMSLRAPALLVAGFVLALSVRGFSADDEWVTLFNGKDLSGWSQKNGTATYRVEEGTIVGKTNEGSPNSFLCSEKEYGDFELKFEVKVDDALNSGVQIRSASKPDKDNGRVHGPQVEIATNGSAGCVYGEATKFGWLSGPDKLNDQQKTAFKKGEWNKYRVLCKGKSIKTWINDIAIVDFEEDKTEMPKGFLGLQVHGIGKGQGPFEVRWRNISIREVK